MWPNGSKTQPYETSDFGPRVAPVAGASTFHRGSDFVGFSTIRAVADGIVKVVGTLRGWSGGGVMVWVQHDGFFTRSLHMASTKVRTGQFVRVGDALGIMGQTGTATDDHLHFELTPGNLHFNNSGQVDPVPFIRSRVATTGGSASGGSDEGDEFMAKIDDLWEAWLPGKAGVKEAGDAYKLFVEIVTKVRALGTTVAKAVWATPVNRGGKNVTALQEVADAKTLGIDANRKLDDLLKRPAASVELTDAQLERMAGKVGEKVALTLAPAVLDLMSKRLQS